MWFDLRPVDADYGQRAPYSFRFDIELDASPERVFDLLGDIQAWPQWFPDMTGMRWLSPEGMRERPGARRQADAKSSNVRECFLVWDRGNRMAFYVEQMTTPLVHEFMEDYQLEPLDGGRRTKMTWLVHYRPRKRVQLFHGLLRPYFEKMFRDGSLALVEYVRRLPS